MKSYRWFLIPAVLGIGVAGFFLFRSLGGSLEYYLTPTEAVSQHTDFADGRRFKLVGIVVPGTYAEDGDAYTFDVSDGGETVAVTLTRTPPPLFDEDVNVLLDGYWDGDRFHSDKALIRHEEGYSPPTSLSLEG